MLSALEPAHDKARPAGPKTRNIRPEKPSAAKLQQVATKDRTSGIACPAAVAFKRLSDIHKAQAQTGARITELAAKIAEMADRHLDADEQEWCEAWTALKTAERTQAQLYLLEPFAEEQVVHANAQSLAGAMAKIAMAYWNANIVGDYLEGKHAEDCRKRIDRISACLYAAISAVEAAGALDRKALAIDWYFPTCLDPNGLVDEALTRLGS